MGCLYFPGENCYVRFWSQLVALTAFLCPLPLTLAHPVHTPGYVQVTAVRQAAGAAKGGVAFVNLEPRFGVHPVHGAVDGAEEEVQALLSSGVERVVVGLSHPVPGLRGSGVAALRAAGLHVDVMDYGAGLGDLGSEAQAAARACLEANEAVLHRAYVHHIAAHITQPPYLLIAVVLLRHTHTVAPCRCRSCSVRGCRMTHIKPVTFQHPSPVVPRTNAGTSDSQRSSRSLDTPTLGA
jgi:hypothetical protein